jgi:hypothetical protein
MTEREYELATLINKYQYEIAKLKEQLFAQPEQDKTQYLLDQVSRLFAENAMLKEKWSQPKREPLSNVQLSKIWKEKYKTGFNAIEYYLFAELFRDAEKAHGITGGGE